MRPALLFAFTACVMIAGGEAANAQSAQGFPNRPITLINVFAAGGPSDIHLRALANKAKDVFGVPVVVENKLGGAGTVGQPGLEPHDAGRQSRRVHRLHKVVHRLGLEGLQRVLVVSRDEYQQGERHALWPIFGQRLRGVQPAGAGHPDVEKADIGLQRQRLARRAQAVGQLGDDAQFGPEPGQFSRQRSGQQRLVFGDQGIGHDQRQGLRFMLPLILQCFSALAAPAFQRQWGLLTPGGAG